MKEKSEVLERDQSHKLSKHLKTINPFETPSAVVGTSSGRQSALPRPKRLSIALRGGGWSQKDLTKAKVVKAKNTKKDMWPYPVYQLLRWFESFVFLWVHCIFLAPGGSDFLQWASHLLGSVAPLALSGWDWTVSN